MLIGHSLCAEMTYTFEYIIYFSGCFSFDIEFNWQFGGIYSECPNHRGTEYTEKRLLDDLIDTKYLICTLWYYHQFQIRHY